MLRTFLLAWIVLALLSFPASLLAEPGNETAAAVVVPEKKILVYYLYFNPRCETCINMEIYSKDAVETGFADALKNGGVEWHSIDMDSTQHAHFWNDFQLETKSLVIVEMEEGELRRWKNCEKIWDLVQDRPAFSNYVQSEITTYLHGD